MPVLLQVDSSPMGEASISRRLTSKFVELWRCANPQGKVLIRDLTTASIPPINAAWIYANLTPKESHTPEQNRVLALSTAFTTELLEADEYVIGVPMHNWGPSAGFKLWVDQIVRFGETVLLTPSGPQGALGKKRATFLLAAGAFYGPESVPGNYIEPWLRTLFGYLGVRDMRFILADGTLEIKNGKISPAAFLAPHSDAIQALFAK